VLLAFVGTSIKPFRIRYGVIMSNTISKSQCGGAILGKLVASYPSERAMQKALNPSPSVKQWCAFKIITDLPGLKSGMRMNLY